MDKKLAVKKAKKFSEKIIGILPIDSIILYGSYARGTNHKNSDIDIAIIVKKFDKDYFETYRKLTDAGNEIDYRIESIILEKDKDFSGFLQTISKEGIVVYKAA